MSRYDRQMRLEEVGILGQKNLSQAKVLCVGAGGLGSPILMYLAGAGIGTLGVIDGDTVTENNLQRQILFTEDDLGKPKAFASKERLEKINHEIKIVTYNTFLAPDNVEDIFKEYDLIVDGTDNFEAKFLINKVAKKLNKSWIYGSVTGFEGQIIFFESTGPCLQCLIPQKPKRTPFSCAELGVVGAMVGWVGSIQGLKAIQYFLPSFKEGCSEAKLMVLDGLNYSLQNLTLHQNPNCPICSTDLSRLESNKSDKKSFQQSSLKSSLQNPRLNELNRAQLNFNPDDFLLLDLCDETTPLFFKAAQRYSMGDLFTMATAPEAWLQSAKPLLLFCEQGHKSMSALIYLRHLGISNVSHIEGGIWQWV